MRYALVLQFIQIQVEDNVYLDQGKSCPKENNRFREVVCNTCPYVSISWFAMKALSTNLSVRMTGNLPEPLVVFYMDNTFDDLK